ncbi:MAG TPA: PilX N-terminal domain-containing pilus assembly protein [Gammaproteobacteria bacterium]|nr:PilX N-terminal domain-containing pilus assembly protein [Gammaproteobacteria bacterium]
MMPLPHRSLPRAQRGAVLIIALILLAVMTLLAVTAMNMNSMEERMAANVQEINRAFQTAESGLSMALADSNSFNTSCTTAALCTSAPQTIGTYNASTTYNSVFVQQTPPARGSGWDASRFAFYYFNLSSTSTTTSGAGTVLNEGAYQVAKR